MIVEADCRAKYPEIMAFSSGDDGHQSVYLEAGESTLHREDSDKPTEIRFDDLPPGRWTVDATSSKYSVFIFLYRLSDSPPSLWWEGDERV
jgi:hypothetical protein